MVYEFKYIFTIFKQLYTYFYTLFHPHIFSKNINNIIRIILLFFKEKLAKSIFFPTFNPTVIDAQARHVLEDIRCTVPFPNFKLPSQASSNWAIFSKNKELYHKLKKKKEHFQIYSQLTNATLKKLCDHGLCVRYLLLLLLHHLQPRFTSSSR